MVTPFWFQASSPICINVLFILYFVIFSTKKKQLRQRRNRQSKENLKDITDSSFCLCFFYVCANKLSHGLDYAYL